MDKDELLRLVQEVALQEVCPNTGDPATIYELSAVSRLTCFGLTLLGRAAQQGFLDLSRAPRWWTHSVSGATVPSTQEASDDHVPH